MGKQALRSAANLAPRPRGIASEMRIRTLIYSRRAAIRFARPAPLSNRRARWYSSGMQISGNSVEGRPPGHAGWSAQAKATSVMAILKRKATAAETAATLGVEETEVAAWVRLFVEAGEEGLRGRALPGAASQGPGAAVGLTHLDQVRENESLRSALRELRDETRLWREAAQGVLGPCGTLR